MPRFGSQHSHKCYICVTPELGSGAGVREAHCWSSLTNQPSWMLSQGQWQIWTRRTPPHKCLAWHPHMVLTKMKLTPHAFSLIFCRHHYARDLFIWVSLRFLDLFGRACGSLLSTPSTFTEPKARSHSAERSKATEIKLIVIALSVTLWHAWGLLGRELLPMTRVKSQPILWNSSLFR